MYTQKILAQIEKLNSSIVSSGNFGVIQYDSHDIGAIMYQDFSAIFVSYIHILNSIVYCVPSS